MRRVSVDNKEERLNDFTGDNNDNNNLDDKLDLLNLSTSLSSETRDKFKSKGQKRESRNFEIRCEKDGHHDHRPRRCRHLYNNTKGLSFEGHPCTKNIDLLTLKPILRSSSTRRTCSVVKHHTEPDDRSVLLLYSNNNGLPQAQTASRTESEESLPRKSKRRKKSRKIRTVYIDTTEAMSHKSDLKRVPLVKQSQLEVGTFPFKVTSSGNLKVTSQQVVFESQKLSVLVADPKRTKVNINSNCEGEAGGSERMDEKQKRNPILDSIVKKEGASSLDNLLHSSAPVRKDKESSEYQEKPTDHILDPELNLNRLGYTASDPIDWTEVKLPEKTNLYLELYQRITNYTNADLKVYIANEEFNCHLIVLQCYSEVFDDYVAVKRVELPVDKVSTSAFAFIYEWMITGDPGYTELTRENVLEIFNASKYLKIKDLTEQCWAFIDNRDVFSEDTAFLLYMDAKEKGMDDVKELMLPRVQTFFLMLVSSQDWLELDKEDVINLLSSNYISINCEMEVFMSAVRWLKHDWDVRQDDVIDIMECVRFGHIPPWQLVDIKRNRENPDFLNLASIPEIGNMIYDGQSFVIIRYWYGQHKEDFEQWRNILDLKQPKDRNWSGSEKTYFTYREFLIYLDQYRRKQMLEKTKPHKKIKPSTEVKSIYPQNEPLESRMPSMDDFLSIKKTKDENMLFSKNQAATVIQAIYRGYKTRKKLKEYYSASSLRNPRKKAHLYKGRTSNHPWPSLASTKVFSMFNTARPFSKGRLNEMSLSALAPVQKDYLAENSLFIADRESVLVFGGIDPHGINGVGRNTGKEVYRYLPDANVWEYVGDLPEPRHHHSVAFLKGRVYLCGGADPREDDVRGRSVIVDTVWSFEPVKRCWFSEGSLCSPRRNFGLVTSSYSMYAIGGQDRLGRTLSSVERLNPDTGSWEFLSPMNVPRMGVACTKYRDYIWAVGGMLDYSERIITDSVECYDVRKNQWTAITRLRCPRSFGRLFSMSDRLYFIGGAGKMSGKDKTTTSSSSIDLWDNSTMEWKRQTDMAIPRHGHTVAYLGTQILIIGGVTTIYMHTLSNVECYCTERGTWVRGVATLPTPLSGHAAVTLPPASLM